MKIEDLMDFLEHVNSRAGELDISRKLPMNPRVG